MGILANKIRTGALQTNPLAPGRYWIDLFGSKEYRDCLAACYNNTILLGPAAYYTCKAVCYTYPGGADEGTDAFNEWGEANSSSVKVIRQERYDENLVGSFAPPRSWLLFELVNPVVWPSALAQRIGVPTPASESVNTSDDTVTKPPPEKGPLEQGGLLDEAKPWLIGGGVLIGLALVVSLVRR